MGVSRTRTRPAARELPGTALGMGTEAAALVALAAPRPPGPPACGARPRRGGAGGGREAGSPAPRASGRAGNASGARTLGEEVKRASSCGCGRCHGDRKTGCGDLRLRRAPRAPREAPGPSGVCVTVARRRGCSPTWGGGEEDDLGEQASRASP